MGNRIRFAFKVKVVMPVFILMVWKLGKEQRQRQCNTDKKYSLTAKKNGCSDAAPIQTGSKLTVRSWEF